MAAAAGRGAGARARGLVDAALEPWPALGRCILMPKKRQQI
jgi:hypothetical protein